MKSILVLVNQPQRFESQLTLVQSLLKQYQITLLVDFPRDSLNQFVIDSRINVITWREGSENSRANTQKINKVKRKSLYYGIKKSSFYSFYRGTSSYVKLRKSYRRLLYILENSHYDCIIVNSDRSPGIEQVVLRYSKKKHIPIIIPYYVFTSPETSLELRRRKMNKIEYSNSLNLLSRLIRVFMPNQFNNEFSFYPIHYLLALNWFGTLSDNPWCIGCGISSFVCADNGWTMRRYQRLGVPKRKLILTGDVNYDAVLDSKLNRRIIKNRLLNKPELTQNKKIVLIAIPQLAEHDLLDWNSHWFEVEFLISELKDLDVEILCSLHPKMNYKVYEKKLRNLSCSIVREPLNSVIGIADVFVSTYSSTVIWAILCEVHTVTIDFYELNYTFFDEILGGKIITDRKIYRKEVQRLLNADYAEGSEILELNRAAIFDGNTLKRYEKLIENIILA